ncbi:IGBP1 family protein [Megaselia abdita]
MEGTVTSMIMTEDISTNDSNLNEIYQKGYKLMNEIENSSLPFNSKEYQDKVKQCITAFEDATRIVSLAGVFSSNEMFEEIISEHIKYLMLPYFLGIMVGKTNKDRDEVLNLSEIYFKDFLKRCEEYEIYQSPSENRVSTPADSNAELIQSAITRNNKIRRFQIKKEIESELKSQTFDLGNLSNLIDDDVKRDCLKKYLTKCILEATDELDNIKMERPMLEYRKNITPQEAKPVLPRPQSKFQPIIITRDIAQKAVFGLGYPSMPVMTVREFYEDRVKEGIFPNAEQAVKMNKLLDKHHQDLIQNDDPEEVQKEILMENDNENYIAQQRAMDDYRDEVRRGDGNRHNRS